MTVASTTRKAGPYTGNGVATSFAFAFKVFTTADISVVKADSAGTESTLVLDSDYSVTLNADQTANPGGSITYPLSGSPLTAAERLAILGGVAYNQTTSLPNGGAYNASIVERALDRLTILIQQILEIANRGVRLAATAASNVSGTLPAPVPLALLGWNSAATAIQNFAGVAGVAVSTFMTTVVAAANAVTARTALGSTTVGDAVFTAASAAAARSTLGAAASGANTDITSLGGLVAGGLPDASVLTADIADLQITTTKLAAAAVTPAKLSQPYTSGTAVVVSGSPTALDVTGIPSWVKKIRVTLANFSTNGSSPVALRLGSGSVDATATYAVGSTLQTSPNAVAGSNPANGFSLAVAAGAADITQGAFDLDLINSATNTWVCTAVFGLSSTSRTQVLGGSKALSGVLDRFRVTTDGGTDTIDSGSVFNYSYWG